MVGRSKVSHGRDSWPNNRQSGQATVETVLLLPVVALFILTVVQVGVVARNRVLLAHAAREGAREAAVSPETGPALAAAQHAGGLDSDRLSLSLNGGRQTGDRLRVDVVYQSVTDVPLVGRLLPDIELSESVTVRVE